MADFCNQCAYDHSLLEGDFKGIGNPADLPLKPGEGFPVICEGCGYVLVDAEGNCLGGPECIEKHHTRVATSEPGGRPNFENRMRERQRNTRDAASLGQDLPRKMPLDDAMRRDRHAE